jgi:hypothetical protein
MMALRQALNRASIFGAAHPAGSGFEGEAGAPVAPAMGAGLR